MATATTLAVTTTDGNKTKTTNITYANPNADDSDLATFTASLLSLSQNTLVSVNRVDKHELTIQTGKSSPNLTASPNPATIDTDTSQTITVTRSGNGALTMTYNYGGYASGFTEYTTETTATGALIHLPTYGTSDPHGESYTITVTCAETDDYTSDTAAITVNVPYQDVGTPLIPDTPEP